jgi:type IV pilus assembly protein PilQ
MNKQWGNFQIRSLLQIWVASSCLFLVSLAQSAQLTSVDFSSLPGDKVELRFGFDSAPPEPKGYNIEKPARIALDLEGVTSGLKSKYHELGLGNARNLTVIEAGSRTRLIISLTSLEEYKTEIRENTLYVILGEQDDSAQLASAPSTMVGEPAVSNQVRNVDFQRGLEGEGKIIITLGDSRTPIDMRKEGDKIHVKLMGVSLPAELERRLDVIDFATPVKEIDSTNESDGALIVIKPHGVYEHLAYQTDDTYIVSVKPLSAAEVEKNKKKAFSYTGEKLSLNFQDIEVRSVLQLIADFTELNLVASDTVGGKITLRLQNVPWDQALDLILKTKGLDKRKVGNVLLVAPAEEIAEREKLELEANKQVEALAPLQSEFFTIKYASAADVKEFLTSEESKISSERGSVVLDSRTNTLLIQDTASKLEQIREIITEIDLPIRQVLIEARVVVASSNLSDELGVRWGGSGFNETGDRILTGDAGQAMTQFEDISSGDPVEFGFGPGGGSYVVDMGVTDSQATQMTIGFVGSDGLLELELSAIEAEGQAEIISTPKVLTSDAQEAKIVSGKKVPIQTVQDGTVSITYVEAALGLTVTPHITPDNRVLLDLDVTQDSISGEGAGGNPILDINQVNTQVLVTNGETIVLGGVFITTEIDQRFQTPFFGDLPIIGRLFRKTVNSSEKQELLVFITPKVINDVLATN